MLELGPGLTVITGETGAGKTMVVTGLGLLLGGRADSGAVRTGARSARVEGLVRSALPRWRPSSRRSTARAATSTRAALCWPGTSLPRAARARSRGVLRCPVSTLSALADPLVAVHGQSDQHRLLRSAEQRDALDSFAGRGTLALRAEFGRLHAALRATESELADVVESARERAREADLLRFGLGEVEAVDPQPDEDTALAAEETRLGFADTLRTAAEQAPRAPLVRGGRPTPSARCRRRASCSTACATTTRRRPGWPTGSPRVSYLLSDVAADVSSYAAGLETDPARLAAVSERRAALGALTRKYGETVRGRARMGRTLVDPAPRARQHRRGHRPAHCAARPAARRAR